MAKNGLQRLHEEVERHERDAANAETPAERDLALALAASAQNALDNTMIRLLPDGRLGYTLPEGEEE